MDVGKAITEAMQQQKRSDLWRFAMVETFKRSERARGERETGS